MSKKSILPQSRRHIMIYDQDWAFISQNYGGQGPEALGSGTTIKQIVHTWVQKAKERANRQISEIPTGLPPGPKLPPAPQLIIHETPGEMEEEGS